MAHDVQRPHDKLFRTVFADHGEAAALLRAHLPEELARDLRWSTLTLQDRSFVDPDLRDTESDLLYSIRRKAGAPPAWLYVLVEHQSRPIAGYASACSSTAAASGTAPAGSFRASGGCAPSSRWSSTRGSVPASTAGATPREFAELVRRLGARLADWDAVRTFVVYLLIDHKTATPHANSVNSCVRRCRDREVIW